MVIAAAMTNGMAKKYLHTLTALNRNPTPKAAMMGRRGTISFSANPANCHSTTACTSR
jgi:hypothetical protein